MRALGRLKPASAAAMLSAAPIASENAVAVLRISAWGALSIGSSAGLPKRTSSSTADQIAVIDRSPLREWLEPRQRLTSDGQIRFLVMIDHPVFRRFAPYRKDHEDWLGAKFAVNHHEGQPGLNEGLFEWMSMLQAVLRAGDRFIMLELGAGFGRWGIFAALAAKAVGIPDIRVRLIEAEPQHARWAAESVRLNGLEREVTLIEAAISNSSERVLFMIDPAKTYDEAFKTGGALAADGAAAFSPSADTYFGYPVYRGEGDGQIHVPAVTLEKVMEGLGPRRPDRCRSPGG